MSIETGNPLQLCMRAVLGYQLAMGDTDAQDGNIPCPLHQDSVSSHGRHTWREAKGTK